MKFPDYSSITERKKRNTKSEIENCRADLQCAERNDPNTQR